MPRGQERVTHGSRPGGRFPFQHAVHVPFNFTHPAVGRPFVMNNFSTYLFLAFGSVCAAILLELWLIMYVCMYVCMYNYVCMYVCMYVCKYVCMYVCMYVHTCYLISIAYKIFHNSIRLALSVKDCIR